MINQCEIGTVLLVSKIILKKITEGTYILSIIPNNVCLKKKKEISRINLSFCTTYLPIRSIRYNQKFITR